MGVSGTAVAAPAPDELVTRWVFYADLPLAGLSPNRKSAVWHAEAKVRAEYLDECIAEFSKVIVRSTGRLALELPPWTRATVHVRARYRMTNVTDGRYRPRDEPNLIAALKPAFDALTRVGVLVDDDYKHMHLGLIEIEPASLRAELASLRAPRAGELSGNAPEFVELRVEKWRKPRGIR